MVFCNLCEGSHASCDLWNSVNHNADTEVPVILELPKSMEFIQNSNTSRTLFAKSLITRGSTFGPVKGQKSLTLNSVGLPLMIFGDKNFLYCINAVSEDKCHWMYFVHLARNKLEQNLVCYQADYNVYFSALRDIQPNEELKVWYAPFYARMMGISLDPISDLNGSHIEGKSDNVATTVNWCGNSFTAEEDIAVNNGDKSRDNFKSPFSGLFTGDMSTVPDYGAILGALHLTECDVLHAFDADDVLVTLNAVMDKQQGGTEENGISKNKVRRRIRTTSTRIKVEDGNSVGKRNYYYVYKCTVCESGFLRTESLRKHNCKKKVLRRAQNSCLCYVCNRSFSSRKLRAKHSKTCSIDSLQADGNVESDKKLTCDICHLQFKSSYSFSVHKDRHAERVVQNADDSAIHFNQMDKHPGTDNRRKSLSSLRVSCIFCKRKFKESSSLHEHVRQYHERGNFACNICQKVFDTKYKLNFHISKHHKERRYQCNICKKKYTGQSSLHNHVQLHLRIERQNKHPNVAV